MQLLGNRLSKETGKKEAVDDIMAMVHKSVTRFKNTLRDLTEVAKVENETSDTSTVNFREMMEEVELTIADLIREYDAQIIEDFAEVPEINFSRKNLRSILYNLVSNAIKYSSPDRRPEVKVSTARQGDFIVLKVADNGLGIKKEAREKVFGMFKRLHNHVEGTGVGMAIVKRIIENNGGKIELESEPGQGSTFYVYLKA